MGDISSSQLTNSYSSEGWLNHQPAKKSQVGRPPPRRRCTARAWDVPCRRLRAQVKASGNRSINHEWAKFNSYVKLLQRVDNMTIWIHSDLLGFQWDFNGISMAFIGNFAVAYGKSPWTVSWDGWNMLEHVGTHR